MKNLGQKITIVLFLSIFLVGLLTLPPMINDQATDEEITDNYTSDPFGTNIPAPELDPFDPFLEPYNSTLIQEQFLTAAEFEKSPDSVTEFAETRETDLGIDPDSDTNGDSSYRDWEFEESLGYEDDVWYYPDWDYWVDEGDSTSWWGFKGETLSGHGITVSDAGSDDGSCIDIYGTFDGADNDYCAYGLNFYTSPNKIRLIRDGLYLTFRTKLSSDDGLSKVRVIIRASTDIYGAGVSSYNIYHYTDVWTTYGYNLADVVPAGKYLYDIWFYIDDVADATSSGTYHTYIDWVTLSSIDDGSFIDQTSGNSPGLHDGFTESFVDVNDWSLTFDESETFTTDGDVATYAVVGDATPDNDWIYNDDISLDPNQEYFIEFRHKESTLDFNEIYIRIYDSDDRSGSYSARLWTESTDWLTERYYFPAYTLTDIECFVIRATMDNTESGDIFIDYIRFGKVNGWSNDGSSTDGITEQYVGRGTISTDGDKLTYDCNNDDARMLIWVDPTSTTAQISADQYEYIEFSVTAVTDGDADGQVWRIRSFESPTVYTNQFADSTDQTGIFRYNLDEMEIDSGLGGGDTDLTLYIKLYMDDALDSVTFDYIKIYGFNEWNYISGSAADETTSVAYYDDSEEAIVMQQTMTEGAEQNNFRIQTRDTSIGYDTTDMVLLITAKASANTSCRVSMFLEGGSYDTTGTYFLYDTYQTIAIALSSTAHDVDYFYFYLYDWATDTGSGSLSIMIKNDVTIRPSWYQGENEYVEGFADQAGWTLESDVNEGGETFQYTDNTIIFEAEGDDANDVDYVFSNEISETYDSSYYVEIHHKVSATTGDTLRLMIGSDDYDGIAGLTAPWMYWDLTESTSFIAERLEVDTPTASSGVMVNLGVLLLRIQADSGIDIDWTVDHIRIGTENQLNTWSDSMSNLDDWDIGSLNDMSTNGDEMISESLGDLGYDYWHTNTPSIPAGIPLVWEIKLKAVENPYFRLRFYELDENGGTVTVVWGAVSVTWDSYRVYKGYFDGSHAIECVRFNQRDDAVNGVIVDYVRIAPSTEMGWQDDFSSINPTVRSGVDELSTDGDILHAVGDGASQGYLTWYPYIKISDYEMVEIRWKADVTQDMEIEFYDEDDNHFDHFFSEEGDGWTITRINVEIKMTSGLYLSRFNIKDGLDGDQDFWLDYVKFYSIADFTVSFSGGSANDVVYVSGTSLVTVDDTATYSRFIYAITISVTTATYNVWNASVSNGVSGFKFREIADNANTFDLGQTRGSLTSTTLTSFEFYCYTSTEISTIYFWEDAVEPTIFDYWIVPYTPNDADQVTITTYATDVCGIYNVNYNAIDYPAGFSDVDYEATESAVQSGLYNYTFSSLEAGYYAWKVSVFDGANTATDILVMQVTENVLSISDIVLITTGATDIQISGKTNMDADYIIYEDAGSGDVNQGSGSITEGWFSISWTKESETGIDVALGIEFTANSYTEWVNGSYSVASAATYSSNIVILNNLFELIAFDTFEVYKNDTRIYHNTIQVTEGYAYNITVKNRFGDTVNSTVFNAAYEMVVFVNTYSFKFMNWYNGFLRVNVTRAGVTYSEIIMPTEIIEFNLYSSTYTFSVDFLNGTTKFSQEITVTNSTGYIITGDSITDVFNLVNTVYAMTTAINVTVTTTNNQVITISLDLTNVNTTIFDQTINILTNIENSNTTIYDQTVSLLAQISNLDSDIIAQTVTLLAEIQSVNSTIYAQTLTLISNLENVNSTIYDQTISLLAAISNLDSDIVSQTVTLLAEIQSVNSTIYSQTVTLISNLENVNSTIYDQTVSLLAQISNLDSDIIAQTVTLLAEIQSVNSTIYAQTLTLISNLENVNSTIYDQTISLLAAVSNLDSDIVSQTVTLLAEIQSVNSTIYSQTVTLISNLENVNSTIYNQTLTLISNLSNVNSTIHSQILSVLTQIQNTNSTIYDQTVSILNQLSNSNSTIYNQTLTLISNINELNATLQLLHDPSELHLWLAGHNLGDTFCDFTLRSTWNNATLIVYDNGVQQTVPVSEGTTLRYTLSTTVGEHNLSVLVNATADYLWYNITYTIAETTISTGDMSFAYRTTSNVEVYFYQVNTTLSYGSTTIILADNVVNVPIGQTFNITIKNLWGVTIYTEINFVYSSHKWIELPYYEFYIDNQAEHLIVAKFSYEMTYDNITFIVPRNGRIILLDPAIYRIVLVYYQNNTGFGQIINYFEETPYYVAYSMNITGNGGLQYTGIGFWDLQQNLVGVQGDVLDNYDQILSVYANLPETPVIPDTSQTTADAVDSTQANMIALALTLLTGFTIIVILAIVLAFIYRGIKNDKANRAKKKPDAEESPTVFVLE